MKRMRLHFSSIFAIALACGIVASCKFDNDMAYPHIFGGIEAFDVEGQKSSVIDNNSCTVRIELSETADISDLRIAKFRMTPQTTLETPISEKIDLRAPKTLLLRTYQDYIWTISAVQNINRYVKAVNQIGDAVFNDAERSIMIYVSEDQPLTEITIEAMKLEAEGSQIVSTTCVEQKGELLESVTRDCLFPMTLECVLERSFLVRMTDGSTCEWSLSVVHKKMDLKISDVNARARGAVVTAQHDGKGVPSISYRASGELQWKDAEHSREISPTSLEAELGNLEPASSYEVRVGSEGSYSQSVTFTTENAAQLHNMNFDQWYRSGSAWYPNADDSWRVWDSANPGTASLGLVPTVPEETDVVRGKAAKLTSGKTFGQFAAGNIYTGRFGKAVLSPSAGATLQWGVPFDSRPTALRGFYKYFPKIIDNADKDHQHLKGCNDICQIQVLLTDWPEPFLINTANGTFVDIENDPCIIAYAGMESDEAVENYKEFTLELEYRDLHRKPRYVVVVAAASRYGDFFTGAVGSVLYLDEFEFVY